MKAYFELPHLPEHKPLVQRWYCDALNISPRLNVSYPITRAVCFYPEPGHLQRRARLYLQHKGLYHIHRLELTLCDVQMNLDWPLKIWVICGATEVRSHDPDMSDRMFDKEIRAQS